MPSLRKRVSSYFRQLSFHNELREHKNNVNENAFVTKYLQGIINLKEGPPIVYGKNPTDLPSYELGKYESGPHSIIGCYSGPSGGLTTVRRIEKHLSVPDDDIDFIDTHDEEPVLPPMSRNSPKRASGHPIDNTTMVIKVAGHEYHVTNKPKRHSRSQSLGSISDFNIEVERTKRLEDKEKDVNSNEKEAPDSNQNSEAKKNVIDRSKDNSIKIAPKIEETTRSSSIKPTQKPSISKTDHSRDKQKIPSKQQSPSRRSYPISKSKSEGNPFNNKKRGRIIQVDRPKRGDETSSSANKSPAIDDSVLPSEWNKKSNLCFGISDSLYDRNQITRQKNGDPIADCFGIIARNDSAILAVADGVNWGEKASIAAKSAVHGSLHYLNKTIFNDTKPFEKLTTKTGEVNLASSLNLDENLNLVSNTREVFVSLLRAFNCAHDLILENKGMLTTLTVAVILPLKLRHGNSDNRFRTNHDPQYACCVCNVGDTLAYVYSQKYGIRELTKGSHDVNSNRDMRDALGALGPVDGINPELSNLTLSITTLSKGDIIMVASDGLTDNFDPNVCKFTVNSNIDPTKPKRPGVLTIQPQTHKEEQLPETETQPTKQQESLPKPPVKPPRKSKNRGSITSTSQSEKSSSSVESDPKTNQADADDIKSSKPIIEVKKPPSVIENKASSLRRQISSQTRQDPNRKADLSSKTNPRTLEPTRSNPRDLGYKFLKSKTSLDLRSSSHKQIPRNEDGIPYVTPLQRYELQLLLMEDILKHGISGRDAPITDARRLCENLISFTISITSAKRHTLEDQDMYFDNRNGVMVEISAQEKKLRRKKGLEKVQTLPGKLDHVTVVAYNVGNFAF